MVHVNNDFDSDVLMAPTLWRAVVSEVVRWSVVKTKRRFGRTCPRLQRRPRQFIS